ncbi:MAG: hypothetical protein LUE96_00575 [Lachnospiraceae bacterium]|nr:hypothetical protein [Lachnospiraceae bacterium]
MRINYNVSSIVAKNALANNDARLAESTLKLSSGYKINSAADNPAGLAVSRKMQAQINCLMRANQNSEDGISVVNTADGAMSEMADILQRMNELAIQSANGTNSDDDRAQIQLEIDELIEELDRIADTTQFNAQNILDGTFAYKGYTNTENVKVFSYTEGVTSGTYVIGTIEYSTYEDTTTYYTGADSEEEEYLSVSSADDVKAALIYSSDLSDYSDVSGIKAFPDDAVVTIDDEYITIKASGDFEIKLAVNTRNAVEGSGLATTNVTTTTYTTYTYEDFSVTIDGVKYRIDSLTVGGEDENAVAASDYSGVKESLSDYFDENEQSDVDITDMTCDSDGNMTLTYTYTDTDGNTQQATLSFALSSGSLDDCLTSKTETVKTTYTVGSSSGDDCIALNITGMGAMQIQVGANYNQVLNLEIPDLNTVYLGVDDLDLTTEESATEAIDIINDAINYLSSVRAKIGAYTNRLEHTVANLDTSAENMTAAYSRIMDVDMAEEMVEYSTVQVLSQAATSMLAQANELPSKVLQLLQ